MRERLSTQRYPSLQPGRCAGQLGTWHKVAHARTSMHYQLQVQSLSQSRLALSMPLIGAPRYVFPATLEHLTSRLI